MNRIPHTGLYCLLLFAVLPSLVSAQGYGVSIRHYDIGNGLETRNIQHVIKDGRGFMWLATDLGAYRFDGKRFKLYQVRKEDGAPYAFTRMVEDVDRNLWFYSPQEGRVKSEIFLLPPGADSLITFDEYFNQESPFQSEQIVFFHHLLPDKIWLGTNDGKIYRYDGQFREAFFLPDLVGVGAVQDALPPFIKGIGEDPAGFLWLGVWNRLLKVSPEGQVLKEEIVSIGAQDLRVDAKGRFIYLKPSIIIRQGEDEEWHTLVSDPGDTQYLAPEYADVFFEISYEKGSLSVYHKDNWLIYEIEGFIPKEMKRSFEVKHIFLENDHVFWVAATHSGLYRVECQRNYFTKYLEGNSMRGITKDNKGNLYAASYSGFFEFDRHSKPKFSRPAFAEMGYLYPYWDTPDQLWFGGHGSKVHLLDFRLGEKKVYKLKAADAFVSFMDVFAVYRDRKTRQLWAGVSHGLFRYEPERDLFVPYDQLNGFTDLALSGPYFFLETRHGLLLATQKGVFVMDPEKGIQRQYSVKDETLPFNNILHIHEDRTDRTYWLASVQGGLIHWNLDTGVYRQFTTKDGLSDDMIYAVYEDDYGFLWLPSNKGLMRFDKKTHQVHTFLMDDGIAHDEFNKHAHFQGEDGRLYFGGLSGITAFDPADFLELDRQEAAPPLYLANYEVINIANGQLENRWSSYLETGKILLDPKDKSFVLYFALLDYKDPERHEFSYKIEGFEKNWNFINEDYIRINGLPHGHYSLLVKGKTADGRWSDIPLSIPIVVRQPLYLQWQFILGLLLTAALLTWSAVRLRMISLKKEKEKLEEMVAQRTEKIRRDKQTIERQAEKLQQVDALKNRFFANVSHELRTPLSLIIGPLGQLLRTRPLDEETAGTLRSIQQNGRQLQKLVEEILDLSRIEAQKMKLREQPVHLFHLVKKIYLNFEPEAQNRQIQFMLDFQPDPLLYLDLDGEKFGRILNNLLSNALKFTPAGGAVCLTVSEKEDQIHLQVADTGEGISEADLPHIFERYYQAPGMDEEPKGGLGIGLALSRELATLMSGTLQVNSAVGKGSVFTFIFPRKERTNVPSNGQWESSGRTAEPVPVAFEQAILIVEDHPQMQAFVKNLMPDGFAILAASNGKEALRWVEQYASAIRLIISDIMMPEMDGYTLLQSLKNQPEWQGIPVIMLTARAGQEDKLKALTIGVDDYLTKPFEPEELLAIVNNLLARKTAALAVGTTAGQPEYDFGEEENIDAKWLKELEKIALANVTSPQFSASFLAREMFISDRQLNRRLKKLTGMTPGSYVKEIRLQKARHLLANRACQTVAETAHAVGFSTPEYFSSLFKERFGKLPSSFLH